ncbi:drug resistance MFS-type transporter [Planococcus antarcticus DSM 14505]|uniref:Drug resistance MFS-type transporter n=1 Tax=Planococcus antarcticus DSM 14505 TaxID=1185653 RepID=A0A1C7DG66_9BACL|nr:MDR family MFS transporter [Planococcus antarcticus]ANU10397.1 MFS transporter [Planococcus antarcticus DSM 14505]EIM05613.1 drug resistance MFS-type transporter [Planococcus antarcticus DSM 14505]
MDKTKRPLVLAAVMLAMFVSAVEATIVSTAMPSIASELGGFAKYSWVFSAYLLMSTVTVLIYGKLSDIFGRKRIFAIGMLLFLFGSLLCGFANSIEELIFYRFVQGMGAGAVMPIATTIVGDIYSREERAKVQGYLSSVWGISAVTGPAIGGILVATVGWEYVFWINLPLGLLSLMGVLLYLKEPVNKKKPVIDYKGAALLTAALSSMLYLLVEGGVSFDWLSRQSLILLMASMLFSVLFIWAEHKAIDPMMPFEIWRNKTILYANLVSLATGVILISISSYLPAYVTGVMEQPAAIAGFTLTAMSIGWPLASFFSGRLLLKIGYFKTSLTGGIFLVIGTLLFILMQPEFGPLWAAMSSFFVGLGMGLTSTAFIVSIQAAVSYEQRGSATASNMFMRNLGSTIGVALLGSILNSSLLRYFAANGQNYSLSSINDLLSVDSRAEISGEALGFLQQALAGALQNVYLVTALFALVSFILIFGLRGQKGVKSSVK